MLKTYQGLIAWQKAFALASTIYRITRQFPPDERFGLTSQLRRAAVSVPSNIAEGYNRKTRQDYVRFLYIANGSLAELETQLPLSRELEFARPPDIEDVMRDVDEVERLISALIRSLDPEKC